MLISSKRSNLKKNLPGYHSAGKKLIRLLHVVEEMGIPDHHTVGSVTNINPTVTNMNLT